MLILGVTCLVLTAFALLLNLKESFDSQCGGIGQIPVLGVSVIQLPILTVLGISVLEKTTANTSHISLIWWMYPLLWLASAVIYTALTIMAGRLGEYVCRRK